MGERATIDSRSWTSADEGAHDAERAAVDEVGGDRRRAKVLGPAERVDGVEVGRGFEAVRREAVTERVTGRGPKAEELADPAEVRLLGARRVVTSADHGRHGIGEGRGASAGGARGGGATRAAIARGAKRLLLADGGRDVREIGSRCRMPRSAVRGMGRGCVSSSLAGIRSEGRSIEMLGRVGRRGAHNGPGGPLGIGGECARASMRYKQ